MVLIFEMNIIFIVAPVFGYFLAGSLKFFLNGIRTKAWKLDNIGMGGLPSTHNTITSSTFFTISFIEGFDSSASGVALMICLIVAIDSMDLRRKLEKHAVLISEELGKKNEAAKNIRKKLGHSPIEVLAGWLLGVAIGYFLMNFVHV